LVLALHLHACAGFGTGRNDWIMRATARFIDAAI
jgi:hypothetical protein